jgi:small-conductance mechanosensitive channel
MRPTSLILAAALCGLLWWYHGVAVEFALFGGALAHALDLAATLLTAVVAVVLVAEAVIGVGIRRWLASDPTGFERASVYAVLSIAGVTGVLAHFGVDIATLLATSAILTAILGLALQPTLGGLIAGFTLHTDRILKVGDAIMQDGDPVIVTSMGWRSISGTKADGGRVVLSNSRILEGSITILPRATSIRTSVMITAPIMADPQRIGQIVSDAIIDLPTVDIGQPVTVAPSAFRPERAQIRYRVRYWVRSHEDLLAVEEKVMTRIWYAFQRHGISWPIPDASSTHGGAGCSFDTPSLQEILNRALVEATARTGVTLPERLPHEVLTETGILLLYADDEHIILPGRVAGHEFLLIAGLLHEIDFGWSSPSSQRDLEKERLGRTERRMKLVDMTAHLATIIGPYAEFAVEKAASGEADLGVIWHRVAREIDNPIEQEAFLQKIPKEPVRKHEPGFTFTSRVGPTGALQSEPFLRAVGSVSIIAVPK